MISLRPATPADDDFLLKLMGSIRPEFSLLGLPQEQLEKLVRMQFNAQQREYQNAYPGSQQSIVLSKSASVGRLWVARNDCEIHVVDISLLPEFRRHGIGTALYRELMAEAKAAAKPVRFSGRRPSPSTTTPRPPWMPRCHSTSSYPPVAISRTRTACPM